MQSLTNVLVYCIHMLTNWPDIIGNNIRIRSSLRFPTPDIQTRVKQSFVFLEYIYNPNIFTK